MWHAGQTPSVIVPVEIVSQNADQSTIFGQWWVSIGLGYGPGRKLASIVITNHVYAATPCLQITMELQQESIHELQAFTSRHLHPISEEATREDSCDDSTCAFPGTALLQSLVNSTQGFVFYFLWGGSDESQVLPLWSRPAFEQCLDCFLLGDIAGLRSCF